VSNAGTPQGTISGPNDFKLLINDLSFELDYAKYVDDTTVLSVSSNPADNSLQLAANHLVDWTTHNYMIVNECKTKEMLIHFGSVDNNLGANSRTDLRTILGPKINLGLQPNSRNI